MQRWVPDDNPHQARRIGKTIEEVGELTAVLARISIQGLDAVDPGTGKTNRMRLHEETADVLAQILLNAEAFGMDTDFIDRRIDKKKAWMAQWEAHFKDEAQPQKGLF